MIKFPAGAHDDQVDMCALVGLAVNQGIVASVPEPETVEEKIDDYVSGYEDDDEDNIKLL